MEKQIIVVKPKTLSPKDKEKLAKAGNVVIEHPFPSEIRYSPFSETMKFEFVNCYSCGERIYILEERLKALRSNGICFYCSQGHSQSFTKKTTS